MFYFKIFKAWNPPLFFTQNLMQKCNKKKKRLCSKRNYRQNEQAACGMWENIYKPQMQ